MKRMPATSQLSKINEPIIILKKFQMVASDAIIAGGYTRDRFNNIPYSDIDVYLNIPTSMFGRTQFCDMEFWKDYFELKATDWRSMDDITDLCDTDQEYDVANNNAIDAVFEMTKNELKYNIIVINMPPVQYIEEVFDFGICKTYCDGKKMTFSKEFMSDVEHKTLTFTDKKVSDANFNHAINVHLPKLQKKYPTHSIIIPPKYQQKYKDYKPK